MIGDGDGCACDGDGDGDGDGDCPCDGDGDDGDGDKDGDCAGDGDGDGLSGQLALFGEDRNMNKLSLAWLFSAALVIGCGGNVVKSSGGSGGTGGAGTGGSDGGAATTTSTTETVVPPQCAVAANQKAPYAVTFQFTVGTGQVAFLAEDCYTQFQVTSCASAYVDPVGMHGDCTVDCSDMTGCIDCGACPSGAILVSQGAPHNVDWDGVQYFFDTNSSGCSCHTTTNAPAAKYRVEVPVYVTEQDALNHANGVVLTHEFDLPAPNGIVTVPVGLQPN